MRVLLNQTPARLFDSPEVAPVGCRVALAVGASAPSAGALWTSEETLSVPDARAEH